jgi:hypothetical protein
MKVCPKTEKRIDRNDFFNNPCFECDHYFPHEKSCRYPLSHHEHVIHMIKGAKNEC